MSIEINLDLWPKQMQALECEIPVDAPPECGIECLFGGSTRGGKSHLARIMLIVYCVKIPNLQCILVRKKQQDILDNHVYGAAGFKDLLSQLIVAGRVTVTQDAVVFDNGSRITYKHCQDERQFDTAQGITSHILVVDEATQISERLLRTFRGWCTMTCEMKQSLPVYFRGKLPRILYTANPIGPSVGYFRRHFVKARAPETMERVGAFYRIYIPSRVEDNPSENAEATRGRMMEMGDMALAQALLEGDWDAPVGDFLPEFTEDRHVVEDFTPPAHWFRYGAYDWGGAFDPACAYWCAVSDGESFTDDMDRTRWYPRDALVVYKELYFCNSLDPSKGAGLRNEEMCYRMREMCDETERNIIFLTDSFCHADRGGPTIAQVFLQGGIKLKLGDTNRVVGWSHLRSRLIGRKIEVDKPAYPMIYITRCCKFLRDYLPALPRHPSKSNDAAESGESTHAADCARYLCASRPRTLDAVEGPSAPHKQIVKNDYTFNVALKQIKKIKQDTNGTGY